MAGLEPTASCSQSRRATNCATPGYSISAMIPRRRGKSKIFLSVVIYVVKAAFVPFSARGRNPANAGAAMLCGVSSCPVPDTATALPKQARYQLRYTRLFRSLSGWSCSTKAAALHPEAHSPKATALHPEADSPKSAALHPDRCFSIIP